MSLSGGGYCRPDFNSQSLQQGCIFSEVYLYQI